MKKAWIALILIFALLIIGYRSSRSNIDILRANENIDVYGIKLLMEESELKDQLNKSFEPVPGWFGATHYKNKEDNVEIGFSGFPDVIDAPVLTDIITTNPGYHFYKIRVGDSIEKAEEVLKNNGFERANEVKSHDFVDYKKGKLRVTLNLTSESIINQISIHLTSTNKENVVF